MVMSRSTAEMADACCRESGVSAVGANHQPMRSRLVVKFARPPGEHVACSMCSAVHLFNARSRKQHGEQRGTREADEDGQDREMEEL